MEMTMDILKERILKEGIALSETVLRVDSFLNHQVDPVLMQQIGADFANYFKNHGITKVFTIESSGIAPAVFTALELGVQLVTLKKHGTKIQKDGILQTPVYSFTRDLNYQLTLSKKYIEPTDRILVIDDFLANGEAATGASNLVKIGGAMVAGIGIVIEKSFQPGRKLLEDNGHEVYSLARIKEMSEGSIEFVE
jgi:xanthine phosphoribosyltransferase